MGQAHDDWLAGLGVNVAQLRNDISGGKDASGGTDASGGDDGRDAEGRIKQKPGIFDRALGLNPDRSFTEAAMEPFFGRYGDPGPLGPHEGDSQAMQLARAAGTVVTLPIWGVGATSGAVLDHANHMLDDFSEIGTKIQSYSPSHPTDAVTPSSGDGEAGASTATAASDAPEVPEAASGGGDNPAAGASSEAADTREPLAESEG